MKAKEEGVAKTILFNLSGHVMVDMASYYQYLSGDLINNTLTKKTISKSRDIE